jgi:hypothetical protein
LDVGPGRRLFVLSEVITAAQRKGSHRFLSLRSNPPEIFFLFDPLCARSTPLGVVGFLGFPAKSLYILLPLHF